MLLTLVGCRQQPKARADFAQFFVAEVHGRGGRTLTNASLPTVLGHWEIERDEFGFQIHLYDADFKSVDSLMTQVLGEPKISVAENLDGHHQRMYDKDISGMHIQVVDKKSEIYVVAVGPKKGSHSQNGAANGSQPIRSETNRTPSAPGSRR
jgi:hypothetical protein